MNNVYIDPAYTEIVKKLSVKLLEMRVKCKDWEELDKYNNNRFLNKGKKSELGH